MTLGQAHALAPGLAAREDDTLATRELLRSLAAWALRFSPLVQAWDDALLLDVTGAARLFRGEEALARRVLGGLTQRGLHARAAIAETVGAAYALALASGEMLSIQTETNACLAPLPVRALRIDPLVGTQLEQVGVRTIGELLRLPRGDLLSRFSRDVVLRVQQALGEVYEPITPVPAEERPHVRAEFESPLREPQLALAAALRLLDELAEKVARRGRALRRLECALYLEGREQIELQVALARATRELRHIRELLRQQMERIQWHDGVIALLLIAQETEPWTGRQATLFHAGDPADSRELGELLDRLAGRLGPHAVVRARPVDDHQPERAFEYATVADWPLETSSSNDSSQAADARQQSRRNRRAAASIEPRVARPPPAGSASKPRVTQPPPAGSFAPANRNRSSSDQSGTDDENISRAEHYIPRPLRMLSQPVAIHECSGPSRGTPGPPLRLVHPPGALDAPAASANQAVEPSIADRAQGGGSDAKAAAQSSNADRAAETPPARFVYAGRTHTMTRFRGPQRVETGWWRGPDVRRDYYRVETLSGEAFWMFREMGEGEWFVQGVYE